MPLPVTRTGRDRRPVRAPRAAPTYRPRPARPRVVAVAHALGPERGLHLLDEQDGLGSDDLTAQRFHAVRAHLLRQVGHTPAAAEHFRAAAGLTSSAVERAYLLEQAAWADAGRA
jgi:predicted RNA polymerase sigma factor